MRPALRKEHIRTEAIAFTHRSSHGDSNSDTQNGPRMGTWIPLKRIDVMSPVVASTGDNVVSQYCQKAQMTDRLTREYETSFSIIYNNIIARLAHSKSEGERYEGRRER